MKGKIALFLAILSFIALLDDVTARRKHARLPAVVHHGNYKKIYANLSKAVTNRSFKGIYQTAGGFFRRFSKGVARGILQNILDVLSGEAPAITKTGPFGDIIRAAFAKAIVKVFGGTQSTHARDIFYALQPLIKVTPVYHPVYGYHPHYVYG